METQLAVPGRSHRWSIPIAILAAYVAVVVVLRFVPEERLADDVKGMYLTFGMIGAAIGLLVWFLFWGRFPGRWRATVVVALLALAGLSLVAVRRVEFDGSMRPIVDFRWQPERNEVLAAHRRQLAMADPVSGELVARPGDCPAYRGSLRDGVVASPTLARDWQTTPPGVIWRQPVGGGYAAFAVVGDNAITVEQRDADEAIVCYDIATGRQRWVHQYPALFSEQLGGDGPRATPTVADGRVYSLGATGELVCLDGRTGKPHWQVNILKQAGVENLVWGMSGSPLVYDNLVVVNPGVQKGSEQSRALLAFDSQDGHLAWSAGTRGASYGSPMLATLDETRQILIFDLEGVGGHDAQDGRELWRFDWRSDFDINAAQPVIVGPRQVLITSNAGTALLDVTATDGQWTAKPVWRNRLLKSDYSCPVVRDGFVYGIDKEILTCLDLADGKRRWKGGRYGHGQLLLAGDLLVVLGEDGQLALVEATPEAHRELASIQAIEGRTWNNPTLVDGRAYVRNHLEMACYDLRAQRGEVDAAGTGAVPEGAVPEGAVPEGAVPEGAVPEGAVPEGATAPAGAAPTTE